MDWQAGFKIFGQVMLGIIVGATLYFTPSVVVKREVQAGAVLGPKERATKFEYRSYKWQNNNLCFCKNTHHYNTFCKEPRV